MASRVQAPGSSKAAYTCRTCLLEFTNRDEMAAHFGTPLHRQNIRLRGEGEAPITEQQFNDTYTLSPTKAQTISPTASDDDSGYDTVSGEEEDDVIVEINIGCCLFCSHVADTASDNLLHMKTEHAFTLPLESQLVDAEGMLRYLQLKVWSGICIYCNENSRSFQSTEAVQAHMVTKGHCIVKWTDNEDEYVQYYDMPGHTAKSEIYEDDNQRLRIVSGGKRTKTLVNVKDRSYHKHRPAFARLRDVEQQRMANMTEEEQTARRLQVAAKRAKTTVAQYVAREEVEVETKRTALRVSRLETRDKASRDRTIKEFMFEGRA